MESGDTSDGDNGDDDDAEVEALAEKIKNLKVDVNE